MSELAPGSPWKATVLLAAALPCLAPRRAFAIACTPRSHRPPVGGCFARWTSPRQPSRKERKTSQNPGLATFRRAGAMRRCDTTEAHAAVLQQRPEILGASGSDYGQFQHGGGLHSGLGPFCDGGGQDLRRRRACA